MRILKTGLSEGIRQTALEQGADLTIIGRGRKGGKLLKRIVAALYNHPRITVPCTERIKLSPKDFGDTAS